MNELTLYQLVGTWILFYLTGIATVLMCRDKCEHDWELEYQSTYVNRRTGRDSHHVKHYECTKCHKVKNVHIGY